MKCVCWIIPVLLLLCGALHGQEYNRSSISRILLDYNDNLQKQVYAEFSALPLSDRYDVNNIPTKLLIYDGNRQCFEKDALSGRKNALRPTGRAC